MAALDAFSFAHERVRWCRQAIDPTFGGMQTTPIRADSLPARVGAADFIHIDGPPAVHGSVRLECLYLVTCKDDETLT